MSKENFIIPYKNRVYKIPSKNSVHRTFTNDDELYCFIINDWIPKQPDFQTLMNIFIVDCLFNLEKFLYIIFDSPSGGPKRKAA